MLSGKIKAKICANKNDKIKQLVPTNAITSLAPNDIDILFVPSEKQVKSESIDIKNTSKKSIKP